MRSGTCMKPGDLPTTFEELCRLKPLYALYDDAAYENAIEILRAVAIIDEKTDGQQAYIDSLSILVEAYENENHRIDTSGITPVEVLRTLMEEHGMNASGLGTLLGNRQLGSAILKGDRELSKRHIVLLSKHFRISADALLPQLSEED